MNYIAYKLMLTQLYNGLRFKIFNIQVNSKNFDCLHDFFIFIAYRYDLHVISF